MNRKPVSPRRLHVGATVTAVLAAGAAFAGDAPKATRPLPGVEGDYRIVKPDMPATDPESGTDADGRQFRTGEMDVRISGSIIVDIGVDSVRPPRR